VFLGVGGKFTHLGDQKNVHVKEQRIVFGKKNGPNLSHYAMRGEKKNLKLPYLKKIGSNMSQFFLKMK
jgi:hypothetical protein